MLVEELKALFEKPAGNSLPEIKKEAEDLFHNYGLWFPVTATHDHSGRVLIIVDYPPRF